MILSAHQPVYLPWLGLFNKILLADKFIIYDHAQYLPKDWNNRNLIKTPNGPLWLTVPCLRKGYRDKPIRDIEIDYSQRWADKHFKSIRMNYSRAPYWKQYADALDDFYAMVNSGVFGLTLESACVYFISKICGHLEIPFCAEYSSDYQLEGTASEQIVQLCKAVGADTYIFGAQGRNYADIAVFEKAGIRPVFQDFKAIEYSQQYGEFIPNLSVIDALLNVGLERTRELICQGFSF